MLALNGYYMLSSNVLHFWPWFKIVTQISWESMMKHGSTILKYGSDASVVEADDITSRDVSALEQNQEIQAFICLLC
jgi:hypothetical protein